MNLRWLWRWMRTTSDKHYPRDVLVITVRRGSMVLMETTSQEMLLAIAMDGAQSWSSERAVSIDFSRRRLHDVV